MRDGPAKPFTTDNEIGLTDVVIGSPTTGEVVMGLLTGPVGVKLGTLAVAIIGLLLASGSALALAQKKDQT